MYRALTPPASEEPAHGPGHPAPGALRTTLNDNQFYIKKNMKTQAY